MKHRHQQQGFTLVEIAVVLVIIGLLLGGVLKGQELIASARVRNLADQQAGIQSAYFGFIDRYRAVPGDMSAASATSAIGTTINSGGNEDGRLADATSAGGAEWDELNGVWEQLSKAGFIKGSFNGGSGSAPSAGNSDVSPLNVFSSPLILTRHADYEGTGSARLLLHLGQNVPVEIARELDVKLDDGQPQTGTLRNALSTDDTQPYYSAAGCLDGTEWDVADGVTNCNPTYLF